MNGFDRYGCEISVPTCGKRKEIEKMTLGKKIYTLRSAAQISQEALAERLDVSRQSVSKWEIDQAVPKYLLPPLGSFIDERSPGLSP